MRWVGSIAFVLVGTGCFFILLMRMFGDFFQTFMLVLFVFLPLLVFLARLIFHGKIAAGDPVSTGVVDFGSEDFKEIFSEIKPVLIVVAGVLAGILLLYSTSGFFRSQIDLLWIGNLVTRVRVLGSSDEDRPARIQLRQEICRRYLRIYESCPGCLNDAFKSEMISICLSDGASADKEKIKRLKL